MREKVDTVTMDRRPPLDTHNRTVLGTNHKTHRIPPAGAGTPGGDVPPDRCSIMELRENPALGLSPRRRT